MKRFQFNINMNNRVFYTLIAMALVVLIGAGILVVNAYGGSSPAIVGHSAGEIEGVCKSDGSGCVAESDPTVNNYIKNKGSCNDITGGSGLCDGVDNTGVSSVYINTGDCVVVAAPCCYNIWTYCPTNYVVTGTMEAGHSVSSLYCCRLVVS